MKKLLVAVFVALLMAGCGEKPGGDSPDSNQSSAETTDAKTAQVDRIDLDDPNTRKKIIAEAIDHEKFEKRGEEGEEILYDPDQEKLYTGWVKVIDGRNGKIWELSQCKDGKKSGLSTLWYTNENLDHKRMKATWKEGKLMTAVVWKPNGEKCPVTNVVEGNGVQVFYNEDGTESFRNTYKNGKFVQNED